MLTFQRNMLSLSSGAEVTRQGSSLVTSAPENGDIMFLQNIGIELRIRTAPEHKTSTTT
jgi:hypothetical protein